MAWTKLGSDSLDSTADSISVEFTSTNYLFVLAHILPSGSITTGMRFNDDDSAYYTYNQRNTDTLDSGDEQTSYPGASIPEEAQRAIITMYVQNFDSTEKLFVSDLLYTNGAVPGNVPIRQSAVGKWIEGDQIEKITLFTGANNYYTGTELSVFGSD
tara:strand:+ start:185 stop:655 length:471 start_codon:yes stop_codon:yes gene_type:complete